MKNSDWAILAKHGVTPDNLSVGGSLDLQGTAITSLPDNLSFGGSLDLQGAAITSLPDNLSVGASLYLDRTAITNLPDNLSVGGSLYLDGTAIPIIYVDPRGYELRKVTVGDAEWFAAGCRLLKSRADALSHWGSPDYPNRERGDAFCAAIRDA